MPLTNLQRQMLYEQIAPKLDAIAKLFKAPKVTLLVRAPELEDGDLLMSEDDLQEVLNAVARFKAGHPVLEE